MQKACKVTENVLKYDACLKLTVVFALSNKKTPRFRQGVNE